MTRPRRRKKKQKCQKNCSGPYYCYICWKNWSKWIFLNSTPVEPKLYEKHPPRNYANKAVHILQVGLGTFGTFVKPNEQTWMALLLKASSWKKNDNVLKAIGVDPLEESVSLQQAAVTGTSKCSFLLAAIDEDSEPKSLFCLPRGMRFRIFQSLQGEALWKRMLVDAELEFMENMSSIGSPHRDYKQCMDRIIDCIDLKESLQEERRVEVCTFEEVLRIHNASGCEVLVIDAEGSDCAIIRSMLACCKKKHASWPWVICFETQSLANFKEDNQNLEEKIITLLQEEEYLLIYAGRDAVLVHHPTLRQLQDLAQWADDNYTLTCSFCSWNLYPSSHESCRRAGKGFSQWKGDNISRWFCQWCITHCNI